MKDRRLKKIKFQNKIDLSKKNKNSNIIIKVIIFLIIAIFVIFLSSKFLIKKPIKNFKIGNNNSSQEIVDNILNISSYEATIDMTVYSNKNENRYKIKQVYHGKDNSTQEIIEPSNIEGVKIIHEGNKLKIENSKLNLVNILENYQYIADNCIDLNTFIEDFKNDQNSNIIEENDIIILETISRSENKYTKYKQLKIDKKTGNPLQMEIKSDNKKTTIYILYNEVKIKNN